MRNKLKLNFITPMVFSIFLLGIFFIIAVGSLPLLLGGEAYYEKSTTKSLGNNKYEKTTRHRENPYERTVKTGERYDGWWEGPVITEHIVFVNGSREVVKWRRESNYNDHARHGEETFTKYDDDGNEISKEVTCYNMGKRIDCEKSVNVIQPNSSAFEIFEYKYPWLLPYYNGYGFTNEFIKMYMDTIDQILVSTEIETNEFEDTYSDIISDLESNGFDSIININEMYSIYNGLDILLKNEFRLAVISKLRKQEGSIYNEIENNYANYLTTMNELEITNSDFERFCIVFDSVFTSYGLTDLEDPFFSDTVDIRLFRALSEISSLEDSTKSLFLIKNAFEALKNKSLKQKAEILLNQYVLESDVAPNEVSQTIILLMFLEFSEGDYLKKSVFEFFMSKKNIPILPTITTTVSPNNSKQITGFVIDDGGGDITKRGIAWAEVYNPTINDNSIESGSGTGEFSVEITDMEPGKVYYARSFATNSAGTAYGNNVSINVSDATGLEEMNFSTITIYPNPANDIVNVDFNKLAGDAAKVAIYDLTGKMVFSKNIKSHELPGTKIQIDVSNFENGFYNLHFKNGKIYSSIKFMVAD